MSVDPATRRDVDRSLPGAGRPLRASLTRRRDDAPPEYLPARMVNEFVYCPRLFYYEWVEGVFVHSVDTVEGAHRHQQLERREDELPSAAEAGEAGERIHARSVMLSSDRYKIIARIDLVEGEGTVVTPVDYKVGAPRDGEDGPEPWPADRVQVCAQALVLRDNGFTVSEGVLYYHATRQRVRVPIDDELVAETLDAVAGARALAREGSIPPPLVDSPKCPRCSLVGICLPDETRRAMGLPLPSDGVQLVLFPVPAGDAPGERPLTSADTPVRRLVPAADDLRPLYVTGHGLSVGKTDEVLQVRERGRLIQEVRIGEVSHVNVFGSVTVTGPALQALCWAEKPVAHFSYGGWFAGLTQGMGLKNVFLRIEQFRRADEDAFCVRLAREIVGTKIRNQRTLLQRNHVEPPRQALERLKQLARQAAATESLDALLGVEGTAARIYFEQFEGMVKVEDESGRLPAFDFDGRNRRPPRDPLNALLSFAYSLLTKDCTIVCHAVGFDPYVGFFHQPRFGRPALALDLMEGFRPLVADSAVLSAVNTRMVGPEDFVRAGDAVAMTPRGRKGFLRAYEQRMDQLVTHPLFGYRASYRRVLEIQARLLARVVTGELARYPGFETR
jgi:CRISPR-associated protein Cas1